jgi:hypothetical protein
MSVEGMARSTTNDQFVTPVKAGPKFAMTDEQATWAPAFAGVTRKRTETTCFVIPAQDPQVRDHR